ncbi:hypothetical protein J22TS1_44260 [Siminovitchia terrae]|nr:hypothetical protein J22TS1_44260 [Siminovitchia terrae]
MDVGNRIRKLREQRGMEQLELADKVNISQSKMNKIETGFQKRLEPDVLKDIARVLGVKVDDLLSDEKKADNDEEDFQKFINDPELERWHRELPQNDEEDLRRLRKMWELMQESKNNKKK